jgi:hypothetical protein
VLRSTISVRDAVGGGLAHDLAHPAHRALAGRAGVGEQLMGRRGKRGMQDAGSSWSPGVRGGTAVRSVQLPASDKRRLPVAASLMRGDADIGEGAAGDRGE